MAVVVSAGILFVGLVTSAQKVDHPQFSGLNELSRLEYECLAAERAEIEEATPILYFWSNCRLGAEFNTLVLVFKNEAEKDYYHYLSPERHPCYDIVFKTQGEDSSRYAIESQSYLISYAQNGDATSRSVYDSQVRSLHWQLQELDDAAVLLDWQTCQSILEEINDTSQLLKHPACRLSAADHRLRPPTGFSIEYCRQRLADWLRPKLNNQMVIACEIIRLSLINNRIPKNEEVADCLRIKPDYRQSFINNLAIMRSADFAEACFDVETPQEYRSYISAGCYDARSRSWKIYNRHDSNPFKMIAEQLESLEGYLRQAPKPIIINWDLYVKLAEQEELTYWSTIDFLESVMHEYLHYTYYRLSKQELIRFYEQMLAWVENEVLFEANYFQTADWQFLLRQKDALSYHAYGAWLARQDVEQIIEIIEAYPPECRTRRSRSTATGQLVFKRSLSIQTFYDCL